MSDSTALNEVMSLNPRLIEAEFEVKSDKYGVLIPDELEKEIQNSLNRNEIPFFTAATTGTTLLGALIVSVLSLCSSV